MKKTAVAHANIALAKYWGKADIERNLPSVPSLSMTLAALSTTTTVWFDTSLDQDSLEINGQQKSGREYERVVALLAKVRAEARISTYAHVLSVNNFPTASGLASSASGFAALALAARAASGLDTSLTTTSALARTGSASAARSLFGGFAVLSQGAEAAERFLPGTHMPLVMLIAVVTAAQKSVSSTEAMLRTAQTSPYYPAWLSTAPQIFERIKAGLSSKNIQFLGPAIEESTLLMHASMFAARPAVIYPLPETLAVIAAVRQLQADGVPAFFTMDAGPHVKVVTLPEHEVQVSAVIRAVLGVQSVILSGIGPDAHLLPDQ